MTNAVCVTNLLRVCNRKTEDFLLHLENKHMVWLLEIEEEARKMFSTDFNEVPELMPKTPSQKRRRKKRSSIVPDENRDPNRRLSRRRSSASWSTSVHRMSAKNQNKQVDASILDVPLKPKRMTRAKANSMIPPVPEIPLPEPPADICQTRVLQVKISAEERRSAELQLADAVTSEEPKVPEMPPVPVTPESKGRWAIKMNIANASIPTQSVEEEIQVQSMEVSDVHSSAVKDPRVTPTGSRCDRRSVRRSLAGRQSATQRASLFAQYSLASKRESMTQEAVRKSIRRSISKKKAMETTSSRSYQISVDEEITIKVRPESMLCAQAPAPQGSRQSLRSRGCKRIAISNQSDEPQSMTSDTDEEDITKVRPGPVGCDTAPAHQSSRTSRACKKIAIRNHPELPEGEAPQTIASATELPGDDAQIRRKSYKRAVDELSDDDRLEDEEENSPPRKKTPSPPCPPSKVVRPPPHMKSFLHTVQKNQLLMMTPGSIGRSMVKSFIKRNTPLKADPKEKERLRQEALRKKEEAELERKQRVEEVKKQKQEELKLRREERMRKVLQARERAEQLEVEKKRKIEQKFANLDEKNEKVREDRMAEEKAKKKLTAKKQEEAESRRRQEEEARRLKAVQMEEEEKKHQELLQKKREEEEQERQRKMAEAKKLAEQRQAEQERERLREQQLAAEKEQERLRAERERERAEREKALQLQRELDRLAQEKEQQRREAEERKKRELQERLEQERLRKEQEAKKLREELEAKRLQEEKERKAKELAAAPSASVLNVTVDIQNSPAGESYQMTPQGYKQPKIDPENYGMDLNSDDSTDDESQPRKPIPAWASGNLLTQAVRQQYYNPTYFGNIFGTIDGPKLEELFNKKKPRYFKRTSSAVWNSPPLTSNRQQLAVAYGFKK
ncbi:inner centromere protein [Discoglossus pictus]